MAQPKSDWSCPQCSYINFAWRHDCHQCSEKRLTSGLTGPAIVKPPVSTKPGDWTCSCGELNFASRVACRKCNQKKSLTPTYKPGDWFCQECHSMNFRSRDKCFNCQKSRVKAPSQSGGECVVCMDHLANTCLRTCGHVAMCLECACELQKCPMCRADYQADDVIKAYLVAQ
jgi:hypothetical protein